jgi:2-polyprenyl-6-methoxyphenol hydroxylase-like FAD-dependent oxidoreductase
MQVPEQGLPYGSLSLAQYETERLLEAAFTEHGGRVHYGFKLDSFVETDEGVEAFLTGPKGEARTVRCRWLVGCDGSHSKVRLALGLSYEGAQFPQTFALADVDVDWDHPRGPMYRFEWSDAARAKTSVAAVPVRGSARRYRLSMIVPDEHSASLAGVAAPDFDTMRALLLPSLPEGTQLSSMRWSSVYRVSHRIASGYGHGRVFIAGDAAHIHPPVGGQGMNTGLQDAHNLAWKLAYVAKGLAHPKLLDSYSAERHPVGVDVVQSTSAALNAVLARQAANPAMRETQLLVTYRGSPIVADMCADADPELPAPGDRLPDACGLSQRFVGRPRRLHEFTGHGRHVLLGYVDAAGAQVDAFVDGYRALAGLLPDAASAVLVAAPGCDVSGGGRHGVDRAAGWAYRMEKRPLLGRCGEKLGTSSSRISPIATQKHPRRATWSAPANKTSVRAWTNPRARQKRYCRHHTPRPRSPCPRLPAPAGRMCLSPRFSARPSSNTTSFSMARPRRWCSTGCFSRTSIRSRARSHRSARTPPVISRAARGR